MADNDRGRPLKFKSARELQKKIDEYFDSCYEEWWWQDKGGDWHQKVDRNGEPMMIQKRPFTITGLALHLGTTRETLLDYEDRPDFTDTIKQAKTRIENYTEEQLYNSEARNIAGVIFNLKNNYKRWTDKTESDVHLGNKDGQPFETKEHNALHNLSPKELADLERILSKTADA